MPLPPYGISTFAASNAGQPGQPVHGMLQIQTSSGKTLATGYFNCAGTSHTWGCYAVGSDGYSITSSFEGVLDDMINWNIGIYAN